MKRLFFALLTVIVFNSCETKKNKATAIKEDSKTVQQTINNSSIKRVIDSILTANNIPGLAVGIIDGTTIQTDGFGTLERSSVDRIDKNSIFQIGSDTKKFTAIIARNLVTDGKLNLDEPLVNYLPNSVSSETKVKLKDITTRLLLLQRSGVPYRAKSVQRVDGDAMLIPYSEKDLIADLNSTELAFEPNSEMGYSNYGYAIIGYVCELVSGKTYSELVKFYITDKYGMDNTFIHPDQRQSKLIAFPYRKDDRTLKSEPWKMGKMTPAGGIYSNITDLSKLMISQIEAYRNFSKDSITDNPLILTESDGIDGSHYGFGLSKTIKDNWTRYGHGGDLDGYASCYVFSPEKNVGLIMLTTSGGRWFGDLERILKQELFKP
ncbi:serine hydrolase domain-containing protein [Croceitalea rosinachiae]|uniref:Serine hydrolase domain-containing protein n=1 Tax=Croceitalea rosinachiae TaxID=3075596 RepID=A0ABU3A6M9_9FLAO|nr:serine hydrolase domain-containing protein [Croceitalea sp. F388]MDT0605828.1 serine hydrolase domain-containing protein [Croceitalea sp. F388]